MTGRMKRLVICGAVCAACVAFLAIVLAQGPREVIRFTPPAFEENAVEGVPELTEADGYQLLDAQAFQFGVCGELDLENGSVDLWLTNDADNEVWMKAVVKDDDGNKLGETGLLYPGEYVRSVEITNVPTETVDVGIVVMCYEPETYYSMGSVTLYTALRVAE